MTVEVAVQQEDISRRFVGVRRLYGESGEKRFLEAHVGVVGAGGVGSWIIEGLARNRIGRFTLIDLDMVAESNTNRQIQALTGEYGKAKIDALAARIQAINPAAQVSLIEDFITPENVAQLITPGFSLIMDAIDQTRPKAALIARCHHLGIPIITTGAAGGKLDPTRIEHADLARVEHDSLLAKTRAILRRDYGFPAGGVLRKPGKKFGVPAVFSRETMRPPKTTEITTETREEEDVCEMNAHNAGLQGLSCAGYGSSVCVTASMGFAACALALEWLAEGR